MQAILLVGGIIIIFLIGLGILIYLLIPSSGQSQISEDRDGQLMGGETLVDEWVTIIEVQFKGYSGHYTYAVMQTDINRGQYVLVLTQDGIRCAKVVSEPRTIKTSQLNLPPFLLQTIICVADNADLEYYK